MRDTMRLAVASTVGALMALGVVAVMGASGGGRYLVTGTGGQPLCFVFDTKTGAVYTVFPAEGVHREGTLDAADAAYRKERLEAAKAPSATTADYDPDYLEYLRRSRGDAIPDRESVRGKRSATP